jgi:hypothetical protein
MYFERKDVECQYKGVTIAGLVGLIYGFDEVRAR